MSWNQIKPFDTKKAGNKAGMCLMNVRLGYGIAPKYGSAWEAWKHTQQHGNKIVPKGVDVPLFYDYTDKKGNRYGHINVRLKDGRVWNDGKAFANLDAFLNAWSNVKYVGWGESVNDVRVIREEDEMYKGKTAKQWYTDYDNRGKKIVGYQQKVARLEAEIKALKDGSNVESVWTKVKAAFGK